MMKGFHDELGLHEAAFTEYVNAIQQAPALVGPRSNPAILLARSGRLAEAEQLQIEELGLNPDDGVAAANLERVRQDRKAE